MAAATQNITPVATIEQFSRLPPGSNNIFPRARIVFQDSTTIVLKAALDTNTVTYTVNLPANYAYRLDQIKLWFGLTTSTEVSQFEDFGDVIVSLDGGTTEPIEMLFKSEGLITRATVAGGLRIWSIVDKFTSVFQSSNQGSVRLVLRVYDNDAVNETVAQNSALYLSVLQYDITQILDVAVNAPVPVSVV